MTGMKLISKEDLNKLFGVVKDIGRIKSSTIDLDIGQVHISISEGIYNILCLKINHNISIDMDSFDLYSDDFLKDELYDIINKSLSMSRPRSNLYLGLSVGNYIEVSYSMLDYKVNDLSFKSEVIFSMYPHDKCLRESKSLIEDVYISIEVSGETIEMYETYPQYSLMSRTVHKDLVEYIKDYSVDALDEEDLDEMETFLLIATKTLEEQYLGK